MAGCMGQGRDVAGADLSLLSAPPELGLRGYNFSSFTARQLLLGSERHFRSFRSSF